MEQINTKEIVTAKDYPLSDILKGKKYTVDYFQREYSWKKENIQQLVTDLVDAFENDYKPGDCPDKTADYRSYFMGPIVLCEKNGISSIIDGQQRLTSLTLFLIYLRHKAGDKVAEIDDLIYSSQRGNKSFNIQILEREECIRALFEKGEYNTKEDDSTSIINMEARYSDIDEVFPDDFVDAKLESFVYWIIYNIIIVRINTTSDREAYTIFETMNDRGLRLSSVDMIKGFILSKYSDGNKRKKRNEKWQDDVQELTKIGKDVDVQFFQSWLRAQFAETIRQGKVGAQNQDFENIGMRFHAWFRDNYDKGLLNTAVDNDISSFMENNYDFFLKNFIRIKKAEENFDIKLEHVFYTKIHGIADSLRYPLLLAPLKIDDNPEICAEKIDLVAKYIDIFCVRRSVNSTMFSQSGIRYTMCQLVKTIRNKSVEELKSLLREEVNGFDSSSNFSKLEKYMLKKKNAHFIKYYLARLTSFVEVGQGSGSNFINYMFNPGCKPFEIEHIWADKFEQHKDEFSQKDEFGEWRNKIGDLMLLPNGSNQSYGDLPYNDKVKHYIKENVLAKSLCDDSYKNNPNFTNFVKKNNLSFKPHAEFKKQDILDRVNLYRELSNMIWGNI